VEIIAMNRRQLSLALPFLGLVGLPLGAAAKPSAALMAAVNGPQRTPANRVRDRFRHPAETLTFWGLAPGMTVVEVTPAGGYWTEILAPYLLATGGRYVAGVGGDGAAFKARYSDRSTWGAIEVAAFDATSGPLVPAGSADLVITARNIHDWMWVPGRLDRALADFHAALKPRAILGVEEHRADPRPMNPEARDGYVSTAWLTTAVEKAGFALDGVSEINAGGLRSGQVRSHRRERPDDPTLSQDLRAPMGRAIALTRNNNRSLMADRRQGGTVLVARRRAPTRTSNLDTARRLPKACGRDYIGCHECFVRNTPAARANDRCWRRAQTARGARRAARRSRAIGGAGSRRLRLFRRLGGGSGQVGGQAPAFAGL
jgi:predicted methyltransferase